MSAKVSSHLRPQKRNAAKARTPSNNRRGDPPCQGELPEPEQEDDVHGGDPPDLTFHEEQDGPPVKTEISTSTELTGIGIDAILEQNQQPRSKISELEPKLKTTAVTMEELKAAKGALQQGHTDVCREVLKTDICVKFRTGIVSVAMFHTILSFILSVWQPKLPTRLTEIEQFVLVLMRLRLGLLTEDLACRFNLSPSSVSKIFHAWIDVLACNFGKLLVWPTRKAIKNNLPEAFTDPLFNNIRAIIDCSEIFIQKPAYLQARSATYSH